MLNQMMDPSSSLYDSDSLNATSPFHPFNDFASEQSDFDTVEASFMDSYYDLPQVTSSELEVVDSFDMIRPSTCVSSSSSSPLNVPPYDTLSIVYDNDDLTTYEDYDVISPDSAQCFKPDHNNSSNSTNSSNSNSNMNKIGRSSSSDLTQNVALTQCVNTPIVSYIPNDEYVTPLNINFPQGLVSSSTGTSNVINASTTNTNNNRCNQQQITNEEDDQGSKLRHFFVLTCQRIAKSISF